MSQYGFESKRVHGLHPRPPRAVERNDNLGDSALRHVRGRKSTNSKQTQTATQLSQISGPPLRDDCSCSGNIYGGNTSAKRTNKQATTVAAVRLFVLPRSRTPRRRTAPTRIKRIQMTVYAFRVFCRLGAMSGTASSHQRAM